MEFYSLMVAHVSLCLLLIDFGLFDVLYKHEFICLNMKSEIELSGIVSLFGIPLFESSIETTKETINYSNINDYLTIDSRRLELRLLIYLTIVL